MLMSTDDKNRYAEHIADLIADGVISEGNIFYIQQVFENTNADGHVVAGEYIGSSIYLRSGNTAMLLWVDNDDNWTTTSFDSLFGLYRHMEKKSRTFFCKQFTPVKNGYECGVPFTLELGTEER